MLRGVCLASIFCVAFLAASAQQTNTSASGPQTPQAASIIQQSITAMTGGALITDVTMTGSVTINSGSTTQSGTITLMGNAAGQSQLTLTLPSGTWVTTENFASNPRISTVNGPSGTAQDTSPEDMMGPSPAWFCPALLMGAAATQSFAASYVAQESRNGSTVSHISIWPPSASSAPIYSSSPNPGVQILNGPSQPNTFYPGQHELYVDTITLLPQALVLRFRGHRQTNTNLDLTQPIYIQQEVDFSNYQQVGGRLMPFRTQVQAGGIVLMDIQLSSVAFNSGASIAAN
jgi:hypothetical protein